MPEAVEPISTMLIDHACEVGQVLAIPGLSFVWGLEAVFPHVRSLSCLWVFLG